MVAMPVNFGVLLGELTDRLVAAARSGQVDEVLDLNQEITDLAKQIATSDLQDNERERLMESLRQAAYAVTNASGLTQEQLRVERVADLHRPAYRHVDRKLKS